MWAKLQKLWKAMIANEAEYLWADVDAAYISIITVWSH